MEFEVNTVWCTHIVVWLLIGISVLLVSVGVTRKAAEAVCMNKIGQNDE